MQPLQIVHQGLELPEGQDSFAPRQLKGKQPLFSPREVASFFFGHSRVWFVRNFDQSIFEDLPRTPNRWTFQLWHVEQISHNFYVRGILDLAHLETTLLIIKLVAANYRLN